MIFLLVVLDVHGHALGFQEALKKKQQLPSTPTSLSALRDTATAQTTINHISSSPVPDLPEVGGFTDWELVIY